MTPFHTYSRRWCVAARIKKHNTGIHPCITKKFSKQNVHIFKCAYLSPSILQSQHHNHVQKTQQLNRILLRQRFPATQQWRHKQRYRPSSVQDHVAERNAHALTIDISGNKKFLLRAKAYKIFSKNVLEVENIWTVHLVGFNFQNTLFLVCVQTEFDDYIWRTWKFTKPTVATWRKAENRMSYRFYEVILIVSETKRMYDFVRGLSFSLLHKTFLKT